VHAAVLEQSELLVHDFPPRFSDSATFRAPVPAASVWPKK
jgi:hypothetical protein